MRTFIQTHNQPQQRVSSDITRSSTPAVAVSHQAHPFPHLQRPIGNQAMQRLLQAKPDGLEVGSSTTEAARFAHDFSQIPIHPKSPANVQAELTVSPPGAIYEQEADRVSEQVMRMPDPQDVTPQNGDGTLQRKCSACENEDEEKHDKLERKEVSGASGPTPTVAPAIVHDVLSSQGQPLDAGTRAFLEPRFGHDFGHVRIHADGLAEESARAVDAQAYTVNHHVVFGPSQYSPYTLPGRKLLAHELTHVMQQATASDQLRPADFASSSVGSIGSDVLLRKPDKPTQAERRREQGLEELARDPGEAHQAWKKLGEMERIAVAERMRRRYGGPFAQQFLDEVKKGKPQIQTQNYQPGLGPKPDELIASGYRRGWIVLGHAAAEVEWWVHPSGRRIQRDVSTWKPGAAHPEKQPKSEAAAAKSLSSGKIKVKEPPKEPPLNEKQDKALGLLDQLQDRNNELQDLLISDPIPWVEVRRRFSQSLDAGKKLDALVVDPDFDIIDVDPDYFGEFEAAKQEFQDLADRFRELKPDFASGPLVE